MKKLVLLFFIFFTSTNFAQNLIDYKISEDISIKIPENFQLSDTLKLNIVRGFIGEGNYSIVKSQQKDTIVTIENEKELLEFYDGVEKGFLEGAKGKLLSKEIVTINGLKLLKISSTMLVNGEQKTLENFTLFLNNYSYSILFISSTTKDENFINQKKKIIASLKFRQGLTIRDQFNNYEESTSAYRYGKLTAKILIYVFIISILFFIYKKIKS